MKKLLFILLLLPCLTYSQAISAWWLNGDATDRIGANNGVAHNMTYVAGMQGQAGNFNGTNGYIGVNGVPFQFGTTTWTVSYLVNRTTAGFCTIMSCGVVNANGWIINVGASGQMYGAAYQAGSVAVVRNGSVLKKINDGKWHHCVTIVTQNLSVAGSNNINHYRDGELVDSSLLVNAYVPVQSNDSLRIGKRNFATGAYYTGQIDDVIIEQRAWTAAEIKQKYLYYKGLMQQ